MKNIRIEQSFASSDVKGKYYIVLEHENYRINQECEYLHKDLTWNSYCGKENFWDTYAEAYQAVLKLKGEESLYKGPEFIKEMEFSL